MSTYRPLQPAKLEWQDDTPYSLSHQDIYFSRAGGLEESRYVFLAANDLPHSWQGHDNFTIAETGFGTGLNFLATLDEWQKSAAAEQWLHYISVEKHPLTHADLERALQQLPELDHLSAQLLDNYPQLSPGFHRIVLQAQRVTLTLLLGDAVEQLSQLEADVDAWYLDGFAPGKNPEMWSEALFTQIARLSASRCSLATFTAAGDVRRGLQAAGFTMSKRPGFGRKREMLTGRFEDSNSVDDHSKRPWFAYPTCAPQKSAIVIGAGLAGISTAHALARHGGQVTLIERRPRPAEAASGNLSGVVLPRLTADMGCAGRFYLSAYLHAGRTLNRLKQQHPDLHWHDDGVLQLAEQRQIEKLLRLELPESIVRAVDAAEGSKLSGAPLNQAALHYPAGGWLSPPQLCQTLLKEQRQNINLVTQTRALKIEPGGDRLRVISETGEEYSAAHVIIANGYDGERICADLAPGLNPGLHKVRGQLSYLKSTEQSRRLKLPLCYDGYLIPALDGLHTCGATYDNLDDSTELKESDQQQILEALQAQLAGLFSTIPDRQGGRVAFRTSCRDRLPLVGPLPDMDFYLAHYSDLHHGRPPQRYPAGRALPGVWINSGHGSRGLVSCLISAEIIAARLNGAPLPLERELLDALHPARFLIRDLKKAKS